MISPPATKIYVDGFYIDTIDRPRLCDDLAEVAITDKVKDLVEDRIIAEVVAVPKIDPKIIMVVTKV